MPAPPVIKYYTFSEETHTQVTEEFCILQIKTIIKTYSREILLRAISQISQDLGISNDPVKIKELQKKHLNIPVELEAYIIHRQAVLVILQFIFSLPEKDFSTKDKIAPRDIFLLFTIVNDYLGFHEHVKAFKSLRKKIFFTSVKSVHLMMNENDLHATIELFSKYYEKIIELRNNRYEELIKNYLDEDLNSILRIFQKVKNLEYIEIFPFYDKFAVIEYDKIDTYWNNRNPSFNIPFEYNFFNQYPLVKKENDYLVSDIFNLLNGLFVIVYEILIEDDREQFKGLFGKEIAEPVIVKFMEDVFTCEEIRFIKVGSRSREFADMGILLNNDIFLFEIKTSIFSRKMLYSTDYSKFIKAFNNKFVLSEGITQQIKRLSDIEENYTSFCELAGIVNSIEYKIHPILLAFDECLQSFCANWYLSTRFDNIRRARGFAPTNYSLTRNHITLTFNEIFRLNQLNYTPIEKLNLIKRYSNSENKEPMSFTLFLQHNNLLK